jgi:hypothetical protein
MDMTCQHTRWRLFVNNQGELNAICKKCNKVGKVEGVTEYDDYQDGDIVNPLSRVIIDWE